MALKNKRKQDNKRELQVHELITPQQVEQIRDDLIRSNASLVIRGMLERDVRSQLEAIVRDEHSIVTNGNPAVIEYVVQETIGVGVIEEILKDESITDIGYNGRELIIESNDDKYVFDTNFKITDAYIERLVNKFAIANESELTPKKPVFDGRFEHVRVNAVHSQNTAPESGTTMALRVVRPRLALTKDNFEGFAPSYIYDFFNTAVQARSNMVISGSTGTGKTELHKLVSGFIPFNDRILLIEDTPETFMKEMFKDKDIYSWVTSNGVTITDLIKAGLRNNPTWIMVTETRGKEAYEMIQAVLSGHSIITSLHATNARAIPTRLVNMSKMGYELSEEALLDDIARYFQFGVHIKKTRYKGMVIRYLDEIVEFGVDKHTTVFKQRFVDGVFYSETFELSDEFKAELEEHMMSSNFPENQKDERRLNSKNVAHETIVPLDAEGRPDFDKASVAKMSIDEILNENQHTPKNEDNTSERIQKLKAKINSQIDKDKQGE